MRIQSRRKWKRRQAPWGSAFISAKKHERARDILIDVEIAAYQG
jgi:hypothetical protein